MGACGFRGFRGFRGQLRISAKWLAQASRFSRLKGKLPARFWIINPPIHVNDLTNTYRSLRVSYIGQKFCPLSTRWRCQILTIEPELYR